MSVKDLLANVDELEQLARSGGASDADALSRAKALIFSLRHSPVETYYPREKLGGLEEWFDILYSTRKFEKYPGGAQSIPVCILGDLQVLRRDLTRGLKQ